MDLLSRIKGLDSFPLEGRRILIRCDLDCPITSDGFLINDRKIQAALPTIRQAVAGGGKVVLASRLGNPKGRVGVLSMARIGERLAELLDQDIYMPVDTVGDGPRKVVMERMDGEVVLLENLGFNPEDAANDDSFSFRLSQLADIFINDAPSTIHLSHASTEGVARHVSMRGAGQLLQKELRMLQKVVGAVEQPFVMLLGGTNLPAKQGYITRLLTRARCVCLGGSIATTFLKASGYSVGKSRYDETKVDLAASLLARARVRDIDMLLPVDVVITTSQDSSCTVPADGVPDEAQIVDVGPQTQKLFSQRIAAAKTVLWNGPMGIVETPQFMTGTKSLARALSRSGAFSVLIGQDTANVIHSIMMTPLFSLVSSGEQASISLLEGREMPGLEALRTKTG